MKRKGKISRLLLKNYLVLYCVTTITFIISIGMVIFYSQQTSDKIANDINETLNIMKDDYRDIDSTKILDMGGFIEILDDDLNIIYKKGIRAEERERYSKDEFYNLVTNNSVVNYYNNDYNYIIEYNNKGKFFLIKAIPLREYKALLNGTSDRGNMYIVGIALVFYICISLLSMYFYSKYTARTFLKPLYILRDSANKIASGEYHARINLDVNNEFGDLKDTFNMMAEKIDREIIKRISKEKRLTSKAAIDELTGVYNRNAGVEILKKQYKMAQAKNFPLSICFIDLDELKYINDTLGHVEGDNYIKSCVNIIKSEIREKDILIRLGGDEFVIIFINTFYMDAEKVWGRVRNRILQFNMNKSLKYKLSMSHGIETFYMNNFTCVQSFLNCADMKMYEEKRREKAKEYIK